MRYKFSTLSVHDNDYNNDMNYEQHIEIKQSLR